MRVARWPRPDARQRHQVREVERMDDRLADVRANMAGQARQPRLDGVDALANASEAEPVDAALDRTDFFFDAPPVGIGTGDPPRPIAKAQTQRPTRRERV